MKNNKNKPYKYICCQDPEENEEISGFALFIEQLQRWPSGYESYQPKKLLSSL